MSEIENAIEQFEELKDDNYSHRSLPSSWSIELALSAILEKQARENPQPLTLDELREMGGKLYTSHDVAVILASAIGDDCACNINSNDEWLPQLCELQEACPKPAGVACWEQYLKHRAEAERELGKEQDERRA